MNTAANPKNKHPVTNYLLLDGTNYSTWSAAMRRLLSAQGHCEIVNSAEGEAGVEPITLAKVLNQLSEHCEPEIQDKIFDDATFPRLIWTRLYTSFGPSNTRDRHDAEDPCKFTNTLDSIIAEIKYSPFNW